MWPYLDVNYISMLWHKGKKEEAWVDRPGSSSGSRKSSSSHQGLFSKKILDDLCNLFWIWTCDEHPSVFATCSSTCYIPVLSAGSRSFWLKTATHGPHHLQQLPIALTCLDFESGSVWSRHSTPVSQIHIKLCCHNRLRWASKKVFTIP